MGQTDDIRTAIERNGKAVTLRPGVGQGIRAPQATSIASPGGS